MKGRLKQESGFTLIEIMVAVTIVGIAFAVIVEGYLAMSGLVQQIKEYQLVSSFARQKMHQVILKTDPTTGGEDTLPSQIKVEWTSAEADMGDGVKRVSVYVNWQGQKGPKQYELATLINGGTYE